MYPAALLLYDVYSTPSNTLLRQQNRKNRRDNVSIEFFSKKGHSNFSINSGEFKFTRIDRTPKIYSDHECMIVSVYAIT